MLAPYSTKAIKLKKRSHKRRRPIIPLTCWLKKTSDEERDTPKNARGLKEPSTKKEAPLKNPRGLKRPPMEKEAHLKIQRA
jgi:hypothetical protein